MPWCPKCKSEYREGFTVCAECGSKLVEEEPLAESGGRDSSGEIAWKENEGISAHSYVYSGSTPYRDNSERASENRSSAWVLIAVGAVGIFVLGLGISGIIPLQFDNAYLFYGVMAAVFILFLVAGIVSMKNALTFEKKAESENSVRNTLLDWCRENLKASDLDCQIGTEAEESEESLYFIRFEYIKARLNYQFVNLDQGFLDKLIDDHIYDMVFGKEAEKAV